MREETKMVPTADVERDNIGRAVAIHTEIGELAVASVQAFSGEVAR